MKVLLAAIDGGREQAKVVYANRAPYVLTSFFYCGFLRDLMMWPEWFGALRNAKLRMLDSGAYTLQSKILRPYASKSSHDLDYDRYLHKYIKWMQDKRRFGLFDVWVELDISIVTSHQWVHAQRHKIIAAGLGSGLVNVWHSDADWAYWLYLLREAKAPGRSGYVAIEGKATEREQLDYARFLYEAYRAGVKVHGFRMTDFNDLRRWPFYSVDSSSWLSAVRYGTPSSQQLAGGVVNGPGTHAIWKGVVPRRVGRPMRMAVMDANARAWIKTSDDMTRFWEARGVDWEKATT